MQFSLWGHKPSLWYLLSLSKNISSHFMSWNWHKDNKEGVVYSSFLLIIISVFIFSFFSHHKNLPWVIFTKKWLLSYILPPPAVYVFGCKLFVYLSVSVFWCLDYSRINEQIFIWHKDNKEGVVYSSFLLIIISVFIFSFFLITKIYHEWFSPRSDF